MAYTTINKSTDHFNTKLYTGNGSTQSITGVGYAPNLTWIKDRTASNGARLFDTIRGATKGIFTDSNAAEATVSSELTAFGTDGFTLGSDGSVNGSSKNYVSWNWLASNTNASNTDGSITSTVSVNTTAGFSIVSYTGTGSAATIGHGLGVAPACIIFKDRDATVDWFVYHQSTGATNRTKLNSNVASSASTFINDTSPSSTVFNTEGGGATGTNGNKFIAYCFAEKKGFSKFGSYTGNGNADGAFVYTGFKPTWIMVKRTNSTDVWHIIDNKRDPFNSGSDAKYLDPASSGAEYNNSAHDFYSNGFKIRASGTNSNASGAPYIYMAFGQSLVGDNNIPCTAR